ncbi:MAG: YqaJ viral recombinase family protein [Peptostreptococcaceae bacterium]
MRKYLDSYVIYETKGMSKNEWLKRRKEGIGGSDAASVLGLNKYKSSISVYMDKVDECEDVDNSSKEEVNYRMELGNKLENFVANEFMLKTNKKVRNVNGILKNDKYPFALANIDRAIVGEKAFLECKVTNSYSKSLWQSEVPLHYQVQCYHYMAVTGATHCYVAALIGNEELIIHKIERNEELIDKIMNLEKLFWDECVLGKSLPIPDGSDDYSKILQGLYKDSCSEELILFEKSDLLNRYDEVCELIKDLDMEKKSVEESVNNFV